MALETSSADGPKRESATVESVIVPPPRAPAKEMTSASAATTWARSAAESEARESVPLTRAIASRNDSVPRSVVSSAVVLTTRWRLVRS
jgi:hypothetical protein